MSSPNPGYRYVSPHALVNDGFRWHVRAYCHKTKEYRDFNLSRIFSCHEIRADSIKHENDLLWHNFVVLKLAPHPKLNKNQKQCIEREYGMTNGECELKVRAAFVFYVKQRLDLNQLPNAKAPKQQHIVLINTDEVDSTLEILKRLQTNRLEA
jgi:predicted DNA-binding transcriptional regulator YafY